MNLYTYKIKTERNKYLKRKMVAKTLKEVEDNIVKTYTSSVKIISIKKLERNFVENFYKPVLSEGKLREKVLKEAKYIKPLEISRMLFRFAETTEASVKGVHIINSLLEEDFSVRMKFLLLEIEKEMQAGKQLSLSFSLIPVFNSETINIIKIGEDSGNIAETLRTIAREIEMKELIKKKLIKGLSKPFGTLIFAIAIILYIIPTMVNPIKDIFASISQNGVSAELPFLTQIIVGFSNFITNYTPIVFLSVISVISLFVFAYRTYVYFKAKVDNFILHIPIIGPYLVDMLIIRILSSLSMYIDSGYPIAKALKQIVPTINNLELRADFTFVLDKVNKGKNLAEAMSQSIFISDYIKSEIGVAAKEGSIGKKLKEIIDLLDSRIEEKSDIMVSRLTSSIGFGIMAIIGIVIIAVYSPMFSLIGKMNKVVMQG